MPCLYAILCYIACVMFLFLHNLIVLLLYIWSMYLVRNDQNKTVESIKMMLHQWASIFSRGQFWPPGIVVACVCPCVRPSVRTSVTNFVRAITHHPFKLGSPNLVQRCKRPNLVQRCKRPWLRSLFCETIDLDLQGQIELQSQNLPHVELVHAITHHQL